MPGVFTASEIVEIGIRIEENGRDFYKTLLERTKSKKAEEIFKFLAGEEERHIAVFRKILDSTEKNESTESYPGEYFSYMNALSNEYVFTQKNQGSRIAKDAKGDKQAVDLGIGFEKDSITFYEGMKKVVREYEHKVIDSLIAQEKNHLKQLSGLKKEL
ncbi:MAG: ferritin family protein [Candidatus Omnitrophica bacterium]|nr:ferritin family protein [Candidatus Omnitrophota bacterium]MDD5352952.1 ferritin family protein [Candidatus Omnitrophota bacterium]MDD5550551.1 ferritin family protein [Candidatus Omnitrophota bacterium]